MDATPAPTASDLVTLRLTLDAYGRHPVQSATVTLDIDDPFVLGRGPFSARAASFEPFLIAYHSALTDPQMPRDVLRIVPEAGEVVIKAEVGRRGLGPFRARLDGRQLRPETSSKEDVREGVSRSAHGFVLELEHPSGGPSLQIRASFGETGIPTKPTRDATKELVRERLIRVFNRDLGFCTVLSIALDEVDPRGGDRRAQADILRGMRYGFDDAGLSVDEAKEHARSVFRAVYVWIREGSGPERAYPSRALPVRAQWVAALRELELEGFALRTDDKLLPPEQMSYRAVSRLEPLALLAQALLEKDILRAADLPLAARGSDGAR